MEHFWLLTILLITFLKKNQNWLEVGFLCRDHSSFLLLTRHRRFNPSISENRTLNLSNSLDQLLKLHERCPFISLKNPHDFQESLLLQLFHEPFLQLHGCMSRWPVAFLFCLVIHCPVVSCKGKASHLLSLPGKDSRGHSNEKVHIQ